MALVVTQLFQLFKSGSEKKFKWARFLIKNLVDTVDFLMTKNPVGPKDRNDKQWPHKI